MKTRLKKKTQKQLGYVMVGAWMCPQIADQLRARAVLHNRSLAAELTAAVSAHLSTHG
jgi:hypothetical protein